MSISTIQQSTEVTDVGQVVITEITPTEDELTFVREIRAYGAPVAGVRPLLFTLRLSAAERGFIELQAPTQLF